MSLWVIATTEI